MNQVEFNKIVKAIRASYGRDKILADSEAVELWYSMLKDMSYAYVASNLENHIKTSAYPPTIADLRNAEQQKIAGTETWVEEWGKVLKAVNDYGIYDKVKGLKSLKNPVTRKVVEGLGWNQLCMSSDASRDRMYFEKAYKAEQQRADALKSLPADVREKIEGGIVKELEAGK